MKPAGHVGVWTLLLVGFGCSEVIDFGVHCEPPNPILTVVVSGPDPTNHASICASRAAFSDLIATLQIEGAEEISLDVDPVTLEISGTTTTYSGKPQRSALVTYSLANTERRVVGFHVTVIDLSDPRCDAQVSLDLDQDGIPWFDQATVDAAGTPVSSGTGGTGSGGTDPTLDAAVVWALKQITPEQTLDSDGDDCPNLNEACRGTLFDDSVQQACP